VVEAVRLRQCTYYHYEDLMKNGDAAHHYKEPRWELRGGGGEEGDDDGDRGKDRNATDRPRCLPIWDPAYGALDALDALPPGSV
jgi:hypothetical protein